MHYILRLLFRVYPHTRRPSDLVIIHRLGALLPASAVQGVHADRVAVAIACWHGDGLAGRLIALNELAKLLLTNVNALAPGSIAHLHHGAKQVEDVGDICATRDDDE